MKYIWITLLAAIIIFGIIYHMNQVAPKPMPGLTANGETVDFQPTDVAPSSDVFEPLDLSSNNHKSFFIKSANAAEVTGAQNERTAPRTMGDENAPVKMYVLSSLNCVHCADLHTRTLKKIEKKYVETGKVFFTYIDFPITDHQNRQSLAGAMVARCVPTKDYFTFLNVLFENQKKWAFKANAKEIVTEYAALLGLSKADVNACLSDKVLQKSIIDTRNAYQKKYKISSTPTTILVKGDKTEIVVGAEESKLELALEKLLK